jgi:hypothetical protein
LPTRFGCHRHPVRLAAQSRIDHAVSSSEMGA